MKKYKLQWPIAIDYWGRGAFLIQLRLPIERVRSQPDKFDFSGCLHHYED